MKISKPLASSFIGSLYFVACFPANATVISIDAAGGVDIKEAMTFQQRDFQDQLTVDDTGFLNSNPDLAPQISKGLLPPVLARVIKPKDLLEGAPVDTAPSSVYPTVPQGNKLEIFPRNEKKKTVTKDLEEDPQKRKNQHSKNESPYAAFISVEAAKYENIDFEMVAAVIEAESNNNPTAVSHKGAMGLMQLMPSTASKYDVVNPFDPEENIRAGTAELARLMDLYDNPTLALAAYNAGQGAVAKHGGVPPFKETQGYVVKVLSKTFEKREATRAENMVVPSNEEENQPEETQYRPMRVYSYD